MSLRLHVHDADDNGVVTPIVDLLDHLVRRLPAAAEWRWQVLPGAWGYGEFAVHVEDAARGGELTLAHHRIVEGLRGGADFDHLHLIANDAPVECGVFDSTFLFLVGPRDLVLRCAERYQKTELVEVTAPAQDPAAREVQHG